VLTDEQTRRPVFSTARVTPSNGVKPPKSAARPPGARR